MEEINSTTEREIEDLKFKSQAAIRCAKAALLLSSLKNTLNSSPTHEDEYLKNEEVEALKIELVKERMKNKKMRFSSAMDFCLQMAILMSLWTLCLLICFNFLH